MQRKHSHCSRFRVRNTQVLRYKPAAATITRSLSYRVNQLWNLVYISSEGCKEVTHSVEHGTLLPLVCFLLFMSRKITHFSFRIWSKFLKNWRYWSLSHQKKSQKLNTKWFKHNSLFEFCVVEFLIFIIEKKATIRHYSDFTKHKTKYVGNCRVMFTATISQSLFQTKSQCKKLN